MQCLSFQLRSHSEVLRIRTLIYEFWGGNTSLLIIGPDLDEFPFYFLSTLLFPSWTRWLVHIDSLDLEALICFSYLPFRTQIKLHFLFKSFPEPFPIFSTLRPWRWTCDCLPHVVHVAIDFCEGQDGFMIKGTGFSEVRPRFERVFHSFAGRAT